MARDKLGQKLAAIRRRAKGELRRLGSIYGKLSESEKQGARGQSIQQMRAEIEQTMGSASDRSGTYLGRNASKARRYNAAVAGNALERLVGEKGVRGRKATQERRDRIFRQQVRMEERGVASATFGGGARRYHYERLFYIATQAAWRGLPNEDRDKAIMEYLGVDSLEEAYDMVLGQNADALAAMGAMYPDAEDTAWGPAYAEQLMQWITMAT